MELIILLISFVFAFVSKNSFFVDIFVILKSVSLFFIIFTWNRSGVLSAICDQRNKRMAVKPATGSSPLEPRASARQSRSE